MRQRGRIEILLVVLMVLFSFTTVYANETPSLKATVSGEQSKDGEITVYISAEDISNLGSAEIELTYDNSKLQYISGEMSDEYNTMADSVEDLGSKVKVAVVYEEAVNGNVPFAEVKFSVLADGSETVKMNLKGIFADIDTYEAMDIAGVDIEVTVDGISNLILYGAIALVVVFIIVSIMILTKKKRRKMYDN